MYRDTIRLTDAILSYPICEEGYYNSKKNWSQKITLDLFEIEMSI